MPPALSLDARGGCFYAPRKWKLEGGGSGEPIDRHSPDPGVLPSRSELPR